MFSFRDEERINILINSLNELLNNYRVRNNMNINNLSLSNDNSSNTQLSNDNSSNTQSTDTYSTNIYNNETNNYLTTSYSYSLEDYNFFTNQRNNILYDELENSIINSLEMSDKKYKKIISEKGKEKLNFLTFKKGDKNCKNDTCPILQTEFEDNEKITQLPCKHCFNTEAIFHWLEKEKAECPVCRVELDYNEIKIQEQEQEQEQNTLNIIPFNFPINMDMDNNILESLISSRTNLFESFTRTYTDPFTLNNEPETQDIEFQQALLASLN